eukprot:TRINITY_DN26479_c0_g1_i1.p1 TRINITY_DN26479_c0_g1~~TRINITY_DN26479_c0_g1_i1.p1  ORF type:complete len:376 (+),score=43.22 TRINITY_DN26479_c0_g1_i1:87-1214(+)
MLSLQAMRLILVALALGARLTTGWTVLTPDNKTALQLASLVTTSNWTFCSGDVFTAVDIIVDKATLIAELPRFREAQVYQYLLTGVDRFLPQIPAWMTVTNVHQAVDAISEYVLAAMLDFTIDLARADRDMRSCAWDNKSSAGCGSQANHRQLKGQTVGILGYGHIGEGVAVRAAAFGMRIVGTTSHPPSEPPPYLDWLGSDADNLRLAAEADFVVVCVPDTPSTLGLVDAKFLATMKASAVLVNIASARVVEEEALYESLRLGAIAGAVLDTWWNRAWRDEGASGQATWPSKFRFDLLQNYPGAGRVLMDPTISAQTDESSRHALVQAAANLDRFARGVALANVVRNRTLASEARDTPVESRDHHISHPSSIVT